ncbi:MAG: hypothetical protein WC091_25235 [Sulfuricellaceae bacterium]
MDSRTQSLNIFAVLLLACSIACVAMSFLASNEALLSQGPQALAVVGDKVWIANQDSLLVTDSSGHVLLEHPFVTLGIESIGSINVVDEKQVLIASRGSTTLRLLRADDAHLLRDIALQFPGGFGKQASLTLWLATSPVGSARHFDIAVATGGDHAVVLFDDSGRFLARTKEGMYRFTNGIWYSEESWWTTDTNRFALRKLKRDTLEQIETIQLGSRNAQRYLGAAIASRGAPDEHGKKPLSTLFRLKNGMTIGRTVDVFADGTEIEYPMPADAEPLDMIWLGNELLVAENAAGNILRFDQARHSKGEFGDAALKERFHKSHERRIAGERNYVIWLIVAVCSFVVALLLVAVMQRTPKAVLEVHPGLPMPDWGVRLRLTAITGWPLFSMLACLLLLNAFATSTLKEWLHAQNHFPPGMLFSLIQIAFFGACIPAIIWNNGRIRRQSRQPEFEPLFNLSALAWLKGNRNWREICRAKEAPIEVVRTFTPNMGFLLLTNQRLLHFRHGNASVPPDAAWERSEIVSVELLEDLPDSGGSKFSPLAYLKITTGDSLAVTYRVISFCTATRVCLHLSGESPSAPQMPTNIPLGSREFGKPWQQTVCSALVPGLGQWMQRRNFAAILFFILAATLFTFYIWPLVWVLATGFSDVCWNNIKQRASLWIVMIFISALDAWQMARHDENPRKT